MKIVDAHSGKRKFLKGQGRFGTKKMDEFQQMLLDQDRVNLLEKKGLVNQDRQSKPKKKSL